MTVTPNTTELYSSHIPALATLVSLGWDYLPPAQCVALRGGNGGVLLTPQLVAWLSAYRFTHRGRDYPLSANAIGQIVRDLSAPPMQDGLLAANRRIHELLTLGITITEFVDGKRVGITVPLVDWARLLANRFTVTEEFELLAADGMRTRRPDIVGFVNGIPMLVIEAKRPDSGSAARSMVEEGISQTIRNQKPDEIPQLFAFAQLLLAIGMTEGRYGTTATKRKFWQSWREEEYDEAHFARTKNDALATDPRASLMEGRVSAVRDHFAHLWSGEQAVTEQDRLLVSLATPARLLELVHSYMLFDRKIGKIVARHPQFFGIRKLLRELAIVRPEGGREGGTIWHTTGSGKSFTMVMLTRALLLDPALADCRVIVVTDRRDLEKQLAGNFLTGGAFGSDLSDKEGGRSKAVSGRDLARRIGKGSERILFTIINKFASASRLPECRNDSPNLIVLVDEGHRSQGGENHERMRKALPNAAYVAFTGTPLLKDDKTARKFGRIVHAYTMQDAVADGTVTPLLYEERKPVLSVNDAAIDNWFEKITIGLSDRQKSDLKAKYGKKGPVYGSANRIELIAWDIAVHFSENFGALDLGLKAQLATDSKISAIRYKKALDATGLCTSAVVISPPDTREGHEDVDEAELPEVQQWWRDNVRGDPEEYERRTIEDFATEGAPDILIVVDKLLTGFDEPRNAVLYIDKSFNQPHELLQAIARVNRLHDQKRYGLLIDYRGILSKLDTALVQYQDLAERTQGGFDIADLDQLYSNVSTEYKRLPALHAALWSLFSGVRNRADIEQYRQLLVPRLVEVEDGPPLDERQKLREDFYAALTEFGMALRIALATRSFFEDGAFDEATIDAYKRDLKFFSSLRRIVREDAQESVDFSVYEAQIRRLVDRHVVGESIKESAGALFVTDRQKSDPEDWSEEKTRNETDIIKSRITRTIEQDLDDDPYAKIHFSALLRDAIAEAAALFEHPREQFTLFRELEQAMAGRDVPGTPAELAEDRQAAAYHGLLRLELGDQIVDRDHERFVAMAREIEAEVANAVAENSLNPQNIEAGIRKSLLPMLFPVTGLDRARELTGRIVEMVRAGLGRTGAP